MVGNDGAAVRRQRIQDIAKEVHRLLSAHGEVQLSKNVAFFQYRFGLTKDKIMEYLKIAEELGQFSIDIEKDKINRAESNDQL